MNLGIKKTRLKSATLVTLCVILISGVIGSPVSASSRQDYFDWGPYYATETQVLGFSFSSLEELPSFTLPDSAKLPSHPGVLPNNPLYPVERLAENVQLAFTFIPDQKQRFRLSLASERLAEAQELMNKGNIDSAVQAILGYQNTLSSINNNLTQTPSLLNQIEEVTTNHAVIIQSLSLSAPPTAAENWNRAVESTRETLDYVADRKGEPSIPENLSTSIQKLKEQGLITSEETEKLYGLENRAQVREELDKLASVGQFPIAETAKLDTAVEDRYPEVYEHTLNNLEFAELRTYQTLPQPPSEITSQINRWLNGPSDTPSPPEIRPYLYTIRAGELAKEIDLSKFAVDQQVEITKFYPKAVVENPTYSQPTAVESPPPAQSPTPEESAQTQKETTASATNPRAKETINDYIFKPSGPLPGNPIYFGKRLFEQYTLATTFDPERRLEYRMRLAEERLAEASNLYSNKDRAKEYEDVLNRYRTEVGLISNSLKDYPESSQKVNLAKKLELQAARHEAVFETGLIPPPPGNLKIIGDVIVETEKAMDRSADALGKPALPTALTYRLQDLKAQGVVLEEEIADLTDSSSREEVREKIRKLSEEGNLPPAEAKRLDDIQSLSVPTNYNQLVEVRKVEELQTLRAVQTELAQTPSLKATNNTLAGKVSSLLASIDVSVIKPEDLAGQNELLTAYKNLEATASAKPINGGQFGSQVIPGASPPPTSPVRADAVLTTCPVGAVFKQSEGCVWENTGKKLNDYDQYRCGPRQYFSFQARTCQPYEPGRDVATDYQPVCPIGYSWNWESQSCQTTTGGTIPLPSQRPEPSPRDDQELEERSKSCPNGSTYKVPLGCVWDENGESVYNSRQYRCGTGTYYSFETLACVPSPKEGQAWPDDTAPKCKEEGTIWNWTDGKCQSSPFPVTTTDQAELNVPKPIFATPGDPFYFLKTTFETVQSTLAVTPGLKANVALAQAKERFAEGYNALEQKDEKAFQKALSEYTDRMQDLYNDLSKFRISDSAKKAIADKITQTAVEQNLLLGKAQVLATEDSQAAIAAASSANTLGVDKASDLKGEPAIPDEIKQKIEALPADMIPDDQKAKILGAESRVEVRINLANLTGSGILTTSDTSFLNEPFKSVDFNAKVKLEELQKLDEIVSLTEKRDEISEKIEKNEEVVKKLDEFQRTFEAGDDVPAEIRPYVRLTRIDEVAQTIRPDIVNLENFTNRKDVQLAVAALQQEYKPTKEAMRQVEDFRRRNPDRPLPPDLARIEALSFSLGVRDQATACFLPSPPFPANTPCPPPGATVPLTSYYSSNFPGISGFGQDRPGVGSVSATTDAEGKPFVYGQGPASTSPGVCPDGYHWMYDSGGWCMSSGGNYSQSYTYTPAGTGSGYTPYSPYYTAPGAPPSTYGYPASSYPYSAPSYYGPAPTYYTTTPPVGTVPGSGPKPIAPGQCPSGFHWMSDSGGWCMADAGTYVPAGTNSSTPYYSPNLTQSSCGPGYYWDGIGCIAIYSGGGSGPSPANSCQGFSCPSGYWLDYGSCSCKSSGTSGGTPSTSGSPSSGSCQPPSSGCGPNSWYDYGSCSCKSSGSTYTPPSTSSGGSTPSTGSCPSGYHWMSDNGGWCMADGGGSSSTYTPPPSTSTSPTTTTTTEPQPAPTTTETQTQTQTQTPSP